MTFIASLRTRLSSAWGCPHAASLSASSSAVQSRFSQAVSTPENSRLSSSPKDARGAVRAKASMFARRGVPKGVRSRPQAEEGGSSGAPSMEGAPPAAEATTAGPAPPPASAGSDEEHAHIVKKAKGGRRPACKHFLMVRTSNETTKKTKVMEALTQESNPALNLDDDARATAVLDVDADKANDHRAILERNFKVGEMIEKGELEAGVYRGQGAYRHYLKRSEGALSRAKTTGFYGPVRGANNVRLTMYIDYKPEICKDYKETGYCGYGDCCKFLHDRTDYKEGWQVDREWEEVQRKKQERLRRQAEGLDSQSSSASSSDSEESADEDGLPFACLKCRQRWRVDMRPVVTRCRHYFCEKCAVEEYKSSSKCSQCGAETHGILNVASKIVDKLEKAKQGEEEDEEENEGDGAPSEQQTRAKEGEAEGGGAFSKAEEEASEEDD
ncbi:hypothetical protein Esti_000531 [Eimeria stiedai]